MGLSIVLEQVINYVKNKCYYWAQSYKLKLSVELVIQMVSKSIPNPEVGMGLSVCGPLIVGMFVSVTPWSFGTKWGRCVYKGVFVTSHIG